MMYTTEEIIEKFDLKKHPEGVWYKRTFASDIKLDKNNTNLSIGSSILFLVTKIDYSCFHRHDKTEIISYHSGAKAFVHVLDEQSGYSIKVLGNDYLNGQVPQVVIEPNCIFAISIDLTSHCDWSLLSGYVYPEFSFDGFEILSSKELCGKFPLYEEEINKYTLG